MTIADQIRKTNRNNRTAYIEAEKLAKSKHELDGEATFFHFEDGSDLTFRLIVIDRNGRAINET